MVARTRPRTPGRTRPRPTFHPMAAALEAFARMLLEDSDWTLAEIREALDAEEQLRRYGTDHDSGEGR